LSGRNQPYPAGTFDMGPAEGAGGRRAANAETLALKRELREGRSRPATLCRPGRFPATRFQRPSPIHAPPGGGEPSRNCREQLRTRRGRDRAPFAGSWSRGDLALVPGAGDGAAGTTLGRFSRCRGASLRAVSSRCGFRCACPATSQTFHPRRDFGPGADPDWAIGVGDLHPDAVS
jgi:hypothetical protein